MRSTRTLTLILPMKKSSTHSERVPMKSVRLDHGEADTSEAGIARLGSFLRGVLRGVTKGQKTEHSATGPGPAARAGRVVNWGGVQAVYGICWSSTPPSPFSNASMALSWRGRHAASDERLFVGMVPLSAVLSACLDMAPHQPDWQGATIIAAAKASDGVYWAAIFTDAVPLAEEETVCLDLDGLIAWVQSRAKPGEIERILATPEVAAEIGRGIPVIQFQEGEPSNPELLPRFRARSLPVVAKSVALAGVAAGCAVGGWLAVDKYLFNFNRIEVPPTAMLVPHELPIDQFLASCHDSLRQTWPVPPGWETEASGCTHSGMDDPHVGQPPWEGGSAYRKFTLSADHNGTLARAAAAHVLQNWRGWSSITDSTILLQRRLAVSLQPSNAVQPPTVADLRTGAAAMFLGLADEIRVGGGTISIMSSASAPAVIRRLIELDRRFPISLGRFSRSETGLVVDILPKRPVLAPASPPV